MARSLLASVKRSSTQERATPNAQDEVAQVAYQLFEQRGGTHGFDREDWLRAEQIVRQRRRGANGRSL